MAKLLLDQIVRVVFYTRDVSQNALMVHHYRVTNQLGLGANDGDFADTIAALMGPPLKAAMTQNATYQGATVQVIHPILTNPVASADGAGAGTVIGDGLPTQTAGLITLRTEQAGRSYRGRKYVPFPAEGSSDTYGYPNAAYQALLSNIASVLILPRTETQGPDSSTMTPIVWSPKLQAGSVINGHVVRVQWATQRRRSHSNRGDIPIVP